MTVQFQNLPFIVKAGTNLKSLKSL